MSILIPKPPILAEIRPGIPTVIEAAAGTGKTYTIEHLFVDWILRGIPVAQILLVTFTEKATAELKLRVKGKLASILQLVQKGHDAASTRKTPNWQIGSREQALINRALFSFDDASIFTIHGLCNRILTEFAFENAQFFELEQVYGRQLFDRAWARFLREEVLSTADEEARRCYGAYFDETKKVHRLEALLRQLVDRRDQLVSTLGNPEEKNLETEVVARALPRLRGMLIQEKAERGLIDFNDMIRLVALRLEYEANHPKQARLTQALQAKFRCALIDEFQDTDADQWTIFRQVFLQGKTQDLFLIGDPKQAIYGFRGADVHTYLQAKKEVLAAGGKSLALNHNFRSTPSLIECTNAIFSHETLFCEGISFSPAACGNPKAQKPPVAGPAAVILSFDPDGLGRKALKQDIVQAFAGSMAREIHRLVVQQKAFQAKEIAVLVRNRNDAEEFGQYLDEAGIPYTFYKQSGLYQTSEARQFYDLLHAVAYPSDQGLTAKALITDFFDVALGTLFANSGMATYAHFYEIFVRWQKLALRGDFRMLMDTIFAETRVFERLLLLEDAERKVTNYQHLADELHAEAVSQGLNFSGLLKFFSRIKEGLLDRDEDLLRLETEREAVQLMTVHTSKGLQFPVVFVYGGFTAGNQRNNIYRFHDEDGQVWTDLNRLEQNKAAHERELKQEAERLYYVALTRAEYRLYVPYVSCAAFSRANGDLTVLNDALAHVQDVLPAGMYVEKVGPGRIPWEVQPSLPLVIGPRGMQPMASPWELSGRIDYKVLQQERNLLHLASYSSLKHRGPIPVRHEPSSSDRLRDHDEEQAVTPALKEQEDLPGGTQTGLCLHALLEEVDRLGVNNARSLESWLEFESLGSVVDPIIQSYQLDAFRAQILAILWHALRVPLSPCPPVSLLPNADRLAEVQFFYPVHDAHGGMTFLNGSIDLVFRFQGKYYFADWKSDRLPDYAIPQLAQNVLTNYWTQVQIYTLAMCRWLGVDNETAYRQNFGGLYYLFVRGMNVKKENHGVLSVQPSWDDVQTFLSEIKAKVSLHETG